MPQHPARGQPAFEAVKQAISIQQNCIYMGPGSIKTQPFPVIEYDDEGNITFNGQRQEEVVEGIEAIAGGSHEMIKNIKFTALPGKLNTSAGPVTGTMDKGTGWVE